MDSLPPLRSPARPVAALLLAVVLWPAVVQAVLGSWYPEPFYASFDAPKLLVLVFGAALVAFARAHRPGVALRERLSLPASWLVLVGLSAAALAAGLAAGQRGSITGPLTALVVLFVAVTLSRPVEGPASVRTVARGTAWCLALAGLYALAQWTGLDPSELTRDGVPPGSFFGNPSFAAEFLVGGLPLAALLLARPSDPAHGRKLDRPLAVAALALGLVHLVLCRSRIDFIALGAAVAVAGIVLAFASGRRRVGIAVAAAAVVTALAVGGLFVAAASGDGPAFLGRSDTVAIRASIWRGAAGLVAADPLGFSGVPFVDLFPPVRESSEYLLSHGRVVNTPHNDALAIALAIGVLGLLLALAAVAVPLVRLARGAVRPERSAPAAAVLASATALIVSGSASTPLAHPSTALLAGVVLGLALALAGPWRAVGLRAPVRWVYALCGIVLVLTVAPGPVFETARTDAYLSNARRILRSDGGEAVFRWLEPLRATDPHAFEPAYELGSLYASAGRLDEAIATLSAAHALRPNSLACRVNLANALRRAGRGDEAARLVDASLELCPWHPLLLTTRAALSMDAGDPRTALEALDRAAPLLPSEPRIEARRVEVRLALEATPAVRAEAVAIVERLLRDGDGRGARDALTSMIRRDRPLTMAALDRAHELAESEPDVALGLVDAAAAEQDGESFFLDASRIVRKAGRPELARALNGKAWAIKARRLSRAGREDEARIAAAKATDRAPTTEHFLLEAQILAKAGERAAVLRAIGQALALGSFDPQLVRDDPALSSLLPDPELEDLLTRAEQRFR